MVGHLFDQFYLLLSNPYHVLLFLHLSIYLKSEKINTKNSVLTGKAKKRSNNKIKKTYQTPYDGD